jgi:two-component system, NtrC family, response regulator PilR
MARILVADDERSLREFLEIVLAGEGHDVETVADGATALARLEHGDYDLVLTDLKMPGVSGMDVLRAAKAHDPSCQVVVLTAFGTTETAVQAMKDGAADYLTKPFKVNELKVQLEKVLEIRKLQRENLYLRERLAERSGIGALIGNSEPMRRLYDLIVRLARTRTNVLITGESGTGKELVARALHDESADAAAPFVGVNCGAIPETLIESELFGHVRGAFTGAITARPGVFEAAGAGTLFLDEVGELPLPMQVKLLRVLQERKVTRVGDTVERDLSCRVIAASNKDLAAEVGAGRFREDLFYRLSVVPIRVPSLAERMEDVPLLAEHFLHKHKADAARPLRGITRAAMQRLMSHDYRGNVRELENAIQRAIAFAAGDTLDVDALPPAMQGEPRPANSPAPGAAPGPAPLAPDPLPDALPAAGVDLDAALNALERRLLVQALQATRGVRTEAAHLLGITFRSLRYRLDKHGIDGDAFDQEGT